MRYTEKIGDVETIYEGTPTEIMDLYIKMSPDKSCKQKPTMGGSKIDFNPDEVINRKDEQYR